MQESKEKRACKRGTERLTENHLKAHLDYGTRSVRGTWMNARQTRKQAEVITRTSHWGRHTWAWNGICHTYLPISTIWTSACLTQQTPSTDTSRNWRPNCACTTVCRKSTSKSLSLSFLRHSSNAQWNGKGLRPLWMESSLIGIILADYSLKGCSPAEPVSASSAMQRYIFVFYRRHYDRKFKHHFCPLNHMSSKKASFLSFRPQFSIFNFQHSKYNNQNSTFNFQFNSPLRRHRRSLGPRWGHGWSRPSRCRRWCARRRTRWGWCRLAVWRHG